MEKLGHECLAAEDGETALQLNRNTPGIDGPALCRLIREDGRDGYTYFIFLTALGDKTHLLAGLTAGVAALSSGDPKSSSELLDQADAALYGRRRRDVTA